MRMFALLIESTEGEKTWKVINAINAVHALSQARSIVLELGGCVKISTVYVLAVSRTLQVPLSRWVRDTK